jgi:hypothetical protein
MQIKPLSSAVTTQLKTGCTSNTFTFRAVCPKNGHVTSMVTEGTATGSQCVELMKM